jgi:arylsulfatase A-like enzyme
MVEEMDRQIGRVLEALDQTGQRDNTIVIFTSDNGGERFSTTWTFSGRKTELLEGGLRIPSVICWPSRVKGGQTSPQMTMLMDWSPTLLSAVGTIPDPAAPADGINLLPVLTGDAPVQDRKLFWRFKANAQRAVREGDYKALKIGVNSFLFNVAIDPMERANLKDRLPDLYKRLTADWDAWNRTMLPESEKSFTANNSAANWADHIGNPEIDTKLIDRGGDWPANPVVRKVTSKAKP